MENTNVLEKENDIILNINNNIENGLSTFF